MRILLLTTYFRPESATNAILMTLLGEELTRLGHQVTVITGMPHYDRNRIEPPYRGKLWVREQIGSMWVHRVYLYVPQKKSSFWGRILNYLSFNIASGLVGLFVGPQDMLLVPSPPLTNGATAWALSRLKRIPFVYNVQDIYPDVAVRLGVLRNQRVIRFFEKMERFVYQKASAISVISPCFKANLLRKGVPEEKIEVIPNFIDENFVRPLPRQNAFSKEQGWDDKFVALFAGNVGLSQGLETLLDAAQCLRDLPGLHIVIAGNGASKEGLIERAKRMQLQNVLFLPLQPYERVPELYSAADVGLIPLRKGLTEDSVPSKLFTIMGVGRAVVAGVDPQSDTKKVISAAQCGICVPPEDALALAEALKTLYENRSLAKQMGESGRKYVEQHYTCREVARRYGDLFSRLVASHECGNVNSQKNGRV